MSTIQHTPTNYAEALAILAAGRTRDSRTSRKIAPNTTLEIMGYGPGEPNRIGIRLYNTFIVMFYRSGATVLDSGRWQTVTTKERMNRYLAPGLSLFQEKHVWYVQDRRPAFLLEEDRNRAVRHTPAPEWSKGYRVEYHDGMLILPDHALHSAGTGAGGTATL